MSDPNDQEVTQTNETTPAPVEKPASVRDSLTSAFEAIEKPESVTVAEEFTADGGGRARDEHGRFIPKGVETKAKPAAEKPADQQAEKPVEAQPAEIKPAAPAVEPPQHWSQADKDKFKSAPPELQSWLLDRHKAMEGDYTRRVQQVQQLQKDYAPIDEMFKPFEDKIAASGHTKTSLIKAWAAVETGLLNGQAPQIVASIIKNYKVDIASLNAILEGKAPAQSQAQPPAPPPVDPAKLKSDILSEIKAEQAHASMVSAIDKFSMETEAGKPAHPFFNDVVEDMIVLAQAQRAAGREPVLKDLYDQACWANPSIRDKLLALRTPQPASVTKVDQAKAKAATARKAGSSVTGAPNGGQPQTAKIPTGSVRDTLNAVAAEFEAR